MGQALENLARGPRAVRVRALAAIFDEDAPEEWGGAELQRKLWSRRWGLHGRARSEERLAGEALRSALRWMADSYPSHTRRAAVRWCERGAAAGDGDAAGWVAYAHAEAGRQADAVRWYRRAVELGDATSAIKVGYALFYGEGVRRDRAQAAVWYRRAAQGPGARSRDRGERNDAAGAMTNLGRMYRKGEGVRQSWPTALRWFTRAARLGHRDGQNFLWKIYDGDEGLPPRHALALRWLRKAAANGDVDAVVRLGVHLWNGKHTRRNRPRAMRLYAQGAERGNRWGMYLLGLAYREIPAPRGDLNLSRRWLRRAAARGLKEARRALKAHPTRRARSAVAPPA